MTNLPIIASQVEEKLQDVELVISQRDLRIFKTGVKEAIPKIAQVLRQILPLYGIDAKPEHLIEITEFVSTYKLISVDELKLAFEKFARQELNLEDFKLYGKVDLHSIGKIINAYISWRQKIYYAMDADLEEKRQQEAIAKRRAKVAEEYDAEFDNKLAGFQKTLEDIPVFWYNECLKRGYITWLDGEKEKLWEEAKQLALKEKPDSDNYIDRHNHLRKIESGNIPRAKALAYQLAVWRKVLLRE